MLVVGRPALPRATDIFFKRYPEYQVSVSTSWVWEDSPARMISAWHTVLDKSDPTVDRSRLAAVSHGCACQRGGKRGDEEGGLDHYELEISLSPAFVGEDIMRNACGCGCFGLGEASGFGSFLMIIWVGSRSQQVFMYTLLFFSNCPRYRAFVLMLPCWHRLSLYFVQVLVLRVLIFYIRRTNGSNANNTYDLNLN